MRAITTRMTPPRTNAIRGRSATRAMTTALRSIAMVAAILALGSAFHEARAEGDTCEGQGDAALIVKGRCIAGFPLKIKVAGRADADFVLFASIGSGVGDGRNVANRCLDFGNGWTIVERGRLGPGGAASFEWPIPTDPGSVGRELCLQALVEDDRAPGGVAITNGVCLRICDECPGSDPCEGGIRVLGFLAHLEYPGQFPAIVRVTAFRKADESDVVGEVAFRYVPWDPPGPVASEDGSMTILSVKRVGSNVFVHARVDASGYRGSRLPRETTLRISVGGSGVERRIHSSCTLPIGVGSYFAPFVITSLEDAD